MFLSVLQRVVSKPIGLSGVITSNRNQPRQFLEVGNFCIRCLNGKLHTRNGFSRKLSIKPRVSLCMLVKCERIVKFSHLQLVRCCSSSSGDVVSSKTKPSPSTGSQVSPRPGKLPAQPPGKYESSEDKGPLPFHPDDIPFGIPGRNPIMMEKKDAHEYYFRGVGKYWLIGFFGLMFLFYESYLGVDYTARRTVYAGKQKDEELFHPITLTMDCLCPYGSMLRVFLEYYGFPYTVVEELPQLRWAGVTLMLNMEREHSGKAFIDISESGGGIGGGGAGIPESQQQAEQRMMQQLHQSLTSLRTQQLNLGIEANKLPSLQLGDSLMLNDSSFVMSLLTSYFRSDGALSMWDILDAYPYITYDDAIKSEPRQGDIDSGRKLVINCKRYDVITSRPEGGHSAAAEHEEWRQWADTTLVHHLCMACHDSWTTSYQSCARWCEAGGWHRAYSLLQGATGVWLDVASYATRMWRAARGLKAYYGIKESGGEALEQELDRWVKYLDSRTKNSNDVILQLSVYGVLRTFEEYAPVAALLQSNTKLLAWYRTTEALVRDAAGLATLDLDALTAHWREQFDDKNQKRHMSRREVEKVRKRVEERMRKYAKIGKAASEMADRGMPTQIES